jgi:hypothetical protein
MSDLRARVAKALGWPPRDVQSLSMQSLRDLVRPVDPALADEMSLAIQSGAYIRGEPMKARLSIRPKTYRDVPGYAVTGRDRLNRQISIFARTREGAETIKRAYQERQDPHEIVSAVLKRGG